MKRAQFSLAMVALWGATTMWGQNAPPAGQTPAFGAGAAGRPADYLKACTVPPAGRGWRPRRPWTWTFRAGYLRCQSVQRDCHPRRDRRGSQMDRGFP